MCVVRRSAPTPAPARIKHAWIAGPLCNGQAHTLTWQQILAIRDRIGPTLLAWLWASLTIKWSAQSSVVAGETRLTTQYICGASLVLAVGLPVRAEPSWHDPVLKKLGVNYTTYVANQVKKFDGHQHLNRT